MEHLFVRYKLSVKLKEKGFEEPCFAGYDDCGKLHIRTVSFQSHIKGFCLAPVYQQVVDWFEKEYKIFFCREGVWDSLNWILRKENGALLTMNTTDLNDAITEALKLI